MRDTWLGIVGPGGRRTVAGPGAFAVVAIALLIYDRIEQKVPASTFWLALMLIVAVFFWMVQTARRHPGALDDQGHEMGSDSVTGLDNRVCLEADLEDAIATPGERLVLLLFDLEGLQAYQDRFGFAAGDELLRRAAEMLIEAAAPLGGTVYRVEECRLALLLPAGDTCPAEIVLAATASLHDEGRDLVIGRSYGEVAIPDEATVPAVAMQIAGRRLASHGERQHRSARRQAHAVLMEALAARSPELREHLRIITYRSISLSRRLGLGREEIDDVALAAELQDVGLLSVPEAVLKKESPLTEDELAMIRNRPVSGARIIGAAPGLASVAGLVRSSCERFDGGGYPDGKAGEEIPLGSRIIAVAVAFAAMTTPRPHRPAGSVDDALEELRRCAGSQFDPEVVEALADELCEEVAEPAPAFAGAPA
jgi:two-component system, cell cycle response regulator